MKTPAAQHTPGPWHSNGRRIEDAQNCIVCEVAGVMAEGLANRALIAAAPELLAALKDLRYAFYVEGKRSALLAAMERGKAVLLKAEGRP